LVELQKRTLDAVCQAHSRSVGPRLATLLDHTEPGSVPKRHHRRDSALNDEPPSELLVVLTDHLRYPPAYESDEPARFRREEMPGQESLRQSGVSFNHHYPIAAACAGHRGLAGVGPSLRG